MMSKTCMYATLLVAILTGVCTTAQAQSTRWIYMGTGYWHDDTKWTYGAPTGSESATIDNGGTAVVGSTPAVCNIAYVGLTAGQAGHVRMQTPSATYRSYSYTSLGREGEATFTQSAGSADFGDLIVGHRDGGDGTYLLSGSGDMSAATLTVGYEGRGRYEQSGGTATVTADVKLGVYDGGIGTMVFSGGSMDVQGDIIGGGGASGITLNAGGLDVAGDVDVYAMYVGYDNGTSADFSRATGQRLDTDYLYVGVYGSGAFTNAGENTVDTRLAVGWWGNAVGSYTLNHGGSLETSDLTLGEYGEGSLDQYGGTATIGEMHLGMESNSSGRYRLAGGTLNVIGSIDGSGNGASEFYYDGGTLNLGNPSITVDTFGIGESASSNASFSIPCDLTVGSLRVGGEGTGELIHSTGIYSASGNLLVGVHDTGVGTYRLSGAAELRANFQRIGNRGQGTMVQTGGLNEVSMASGVDQFVLGFLSGGHGRYEMQDGELRLDGGVPMQLGRQGDGEFVQTGGWVNSQDMIYVGSQTWQGRGAYGISGGELDAYGLSVGENSDSSFHVYGDDALIRLGTCTIASQGSLRTWLDADGISLIDVSGYAILEGQWVVDDLFGVPPIGRYDVLTADGGLSVNFSSVILPNADWTWGTTGNTLWVEQVPEPATLSLLAIGGLAMLRRRAA